MDSKTGKKKSKSFWGKLGSLVHKHKHEAAEIVYGSPKTFSPELAPLSAANNPLTRKKQQPLIVTACKAQDDCSQNLASSDQASQAARIDEQPLDSYASEHYGSECSLSESVRAATAHMAQLRTLLVGHISETHDARLDHVKFAGPNLLAALHEQQQQKRSSLEQHSGYTSPSTDRKVQALLADQMQLLDLVQTLIADHRNSLLERQRLQQQLAATQEALHSERLNKDRAAALADIRNEEVIKVQADLAAASATVKQLHAKRAISSARMQLPPASTTAASVPDVSDGMLASASAAGDITKRSRGNRHDNTSRSSADVGHIATEDNYPGELADEVGPSPLSAGAAAKAPSGLKSCASSRQGATSSSKLRSSTIGSSRSTSACRPAGNDSRRSKASAVIAGAEISRSTRQRRLLGGASSTSSKSASVDGVTPAAASANSDAVQTGSRAGTSAPAQQCSSTSSSQESEHAPGDACVHVQLLQQSNEQQQVPPAFAAALPSAAAKLAQQQASALEQLLLQRVNKGSGSAGFSEQLQQQLMHASVETDCSSLCVTWGGADADAAAAAAGLTKQQLHQLLQRPWLPNASQDLQGCSAIRNAQAAPVLAAASDAQQTRQTTVAGTAAAAAPKRKQWQRPDDVIALGTSSNRKPAQGSSCSEASLGSSTNSASEHDGRSSDATTDHDSGDDSSSTCSGDSMSSRSSRSEAPPSAARAAAADGGTAQQQHLLQEQRQSQQKHPADSVAVSCKQGGNLCSSNGSSWPAMKTSMFGSMQASLTAQQQQQHKPSPCKRRARQTNRSRSQPAQISTSLESAETLSLATTQQAIGSGTGSNTSSFATAAACPRCSAEASTCGCIGAAVAAAGRGQGRGSTGSGSSKHRRDGRSSMGRLPAEHGTDAAASIIEPGSQRKQRQRIGPQRNEQQHARTAAPAAEANVQQQQQHPGTGPATAAAVSDAGCDSDGGVSAVSGATGCTTLSNLACVDLQTQSQARPRPAIVPKLNLPSASQQSGKQFAAVPAGGQGCTHNHSRALLLAQESDMAPLKAQPGSARNRGNGTPRGTANAAAATAAGGLTVERTGGSFTGAAAGGSTLLAVRSQSFTALQRPSHVAAAAAADAASTAGASSVNSARSRRGSATGGPAAHGTAVVRNNSSNGSTVYVGQYWGSSAGSCPASEEPSRQPSPREFAIPIYVPAAAVGHPPTTHAAAAAGHAQACDPFGSVVINSVAAGEAAVTAAPAAAENDEAASEGAGSTSTAYGPAAQQFYQSIPGAPAAQVLMIATPRSAGTPRGLTPSSAAAAAAGSYMTMRPAHMYKSVSTVYAMYSPLRGGLRALGQNKPGTAAVEQLGPGAAGSSSIAEGAANSSFGQQQQQLLGAAVMLGLPESSTGNASEHQWHALLGTVPEGEEQQLDYNSIQAMQQEQQLNGSVVVAAGADGASTESKHIAAAVAAAVMSSPSPVSGCTSDGEQYYHFEAAAAASTAANAMPTRQDFQRMVQQEMQQQQLRLERDVVERGPLLRPDSVSPPPAARHSQSTNIGRQQQQQRASTQRGSLSIQTVGIAEIDGMAVGPLTASSPTRRRHNTNNSNNNSRSLSSSAAGALLQQSQQRRRHQQLSLRQHRGQGMQDAAAVAAVARVEAAAAAVAARVAAVAARSSSNRHHQQQQRHQLLDIEQLQQLPAQDSTVVIASPVSVSSNSSETEEQQQLVGGSTLLATPGRSIQQDPQQQQQQPLSKQRRRQQKGSKEAAASQTRSNSRQRSNRSAAVDAPGTSSRRSASSSSRHRRARSGASGAAVRAGSRTISRASSSSSLHDMDHQLEFVTSYHNPMVTLEDAGLGAADEQALVNAGLVPGFGAAAPRTGASHLHSGYEPHGHELLLPGCCSEAGAVTSIGAVPVDHVPAHMTPLAKERSAGGASQGGGSVSGEQSAAGGQLHWNPLYDPNATANSPILGHVHE